MSDQNKGLEGSLVSLKVGQRWCIDVNLNSNREQGGSIAEWWGGGGQFLKVKSNSEHYLELILSREGVACTVLSISTDG